VNYILPSNPTSPPVSLSCIRSRARRKGYRVVFDRSTQTYSLVDARLSLPLLGLDRVELVEIARAVESVRTNA
jgi:hypothetical protein